MGFRVLYLDADQHVAERVADALDAEPVEFEVVTGRDPEAALNPLGTAERDYPVTGYELPGMDGIEVLDAARATNPDLPVVLFVADGTEAVASRAITAGATDYVRPDADAEGVEHLVDRIRAAVEDATVTPESGVNSDRAYREVFENVSDGVVVHDAETGEILDANRRYCETNGYSRTARSSRSKSTSRWCGSAAESGCSRACVTSASVGSANSGSRCSTGFCVTTSATSWT